MVNTINPADCDRTTVYTGECRNFQDTEWITFNSGRRRSPNARDGNTWLIDVAHGSFWMRDDQVRDLVRLVPARPLDEGEFLDLYVDVIAETSGLERVVLWSHRVWAKKIVERLNANGGVPAERRYGDVVVGGVMDPHELATALRDRDEAMDAESAAMLRAKFAEADRDRLRRAHEIVEGERDQARRERDKWKARAEAAEARTAPAVTREDVRGVIDHWIVQGGNHEALLDDLWRWVSGSDPAVHVVRESQIHALTDPEDARHFFLADGQWEFRDPTESDLDHAWDEVESDLRYLIAVRRVREAEQAVDPVEEKARELYGAANAGVSWDAVVKSADEGNRVDREVAREYRAIARHVLGQEAGDE